MLVVGKGSPASSPVAAQRELHAIIPFEQMRISRIAERG